MTFSFTMQFSVMLFIMFSAMLTAKQYFGDPTDCFVQGVLSGIVDTYCWVMVPTHSVTSRWIR